MPYEFKDREVEGEWLAFKKKIIPRFVEIEKFCDQRPEDNVGVLKAMLFSYAAHVNFLSFNFSYANRFYKIALANEWAKPMEYKGHEEKKVRTQVEANCIEVESVLVQFDKLIKGLATSLTAVQSALSAEKSLMTHRSENQ